MAIAEVGSGSQRAGAQRSGSSSSALTINFPATTAAGNLLILVIATDSGSSPTFTVSDSNSVTWTKATSSWNSTSGGGVAIYYLENAGATASVTVTPSVSSFLSLAVDEFSGVLTSSSLDQKTATTGNGSAPSSGNVTTATDGELYVGGMDIDSTSGGTPGTEAGWTNVYSQAATATLEGISFEFIVQNHGTYDAEWTVSGTPQWAAGIATFKPAASASVVAPYFYRHLAGGGSF